MNRNNFNIYTLGCKVNQYDSDDLKKKLVSAGFKNVKNNADWAIVNTCAVTKTAIRKDRQMISKARNENPDAKIILTGCFPRVYKKEANKLGVDDVFGVGDRDEILKLLVKQSKNIIATPRKQSGLALTGKARYFLKIQDGCEQFCSYCIIPYARGKLKSRPEDEVLFEAETAVKAGYREIVLCGIHLGLYGQKFGDRRLEIKGIMKLKTENKLPALIRKLTKISGLLRIRLSSIEINEVSDELIGLMKENKKLCPHLHIALQSGSDKILKLMNRPYNRDIFAKKIRNFRKSITDIAITTDVIAGFPGEGENEFRETYDFIKKIKFSRLHVFPFSAHEKTPAFRFPNQVNENIKSARVRKLRELGKKLENAYRKKFIGKKAEVLVENIKNKTIKGKSEYYFDVETRIKRNLTKIGEIVEVRIRNY